jgi:hypothetical protein
MSQNQVDKLKLLVASYKSKSISALETMDIEEIEYLISEAKKRYDYKSLYAPIITDIEYDVLINFYNERKQKLVESLSEESEIKELHKSIKKALNDINYAT